MPPSPSSKTTGHLFCEITKSTDAFVQDAFNPGKFLWALVRSFLFCFIQNWSWLWRMTGKSVMSGMLFSQYPTCLSINFGDTHMRRGSVSCIGVSSSCVKNLGAYKRIYGAYMSNDKEKQNLLTRTYKCIYGA